MLNISAFNGSFNSWCSLSVLPLWLTLMSLSLQPGFRDATWLTEQEWLEQTFFFQVLMLTYIVVLFVICFEASFGFALILLDTLCFNPSFCVSGRLALVWQVGWTPPQMTSGGIMTIVPGSGRPGTRGNTYEDERVFRFPLAWSTIWKWFWAGRTTSRQSARARPEPGVEDQSFNMPGYMTMYVCLHAFFDLFCLFVLVHASLISQGRVNTEPPNVRARDWCSPHVCPKRAQASEGHTNAVLCWVPSHWENILFWRIFNNQLPFCTTVLAHSLSVIVGLHFFSILADSLLQRESDHAMFRSRRYHPQAKGVDLVTEQPSCQESASA